MISSLVATALILTSIITGVVATPMSSTGLYSQKPSNSSVQRTDTSNEASKNIKTQNSETNPLESPFELRARAFPASSSSTTVLDDPLFVDVLIDGEAILGTYSDENGIVRENNTLSASFFTRGIAGDNRYVMINYGEGPTINFVGVNGSVVEAADGTYSFSIYGLDDFPEYNEYIQLYTTGLLAKDKKTIASLNGIVAFDGGDNVARCDVRISSSCYPDYTENSFEGDWQLTFEMNSKEINSAGIEEELNQLYGATRDTRLLVGGFHIIQEGIADLAESADNFQEGRHDVKMELFGLYLLSADGTLELRPSGELDFTSKDLPQNHVLEYELQSLKIDVVGNSIRYHATAIGDTDGEGGIVSGKVMFTSKIDFESRDEQIAMNHTNTLKAKITTESGTTLDFDTKNTSTGSIELSDLQN